MLFVANQLTINVTDGYTFRQCNQQDYAAACVVVEDLEHVHSSLEKKTTNCNSLQSTKK